MNKDRKLWLLQFKKVHTETRPHAAGVMKVDVLDFSQAFDGRAVLNPEGVKRFGWLLYLGGPNDPLVGSEDEPRLSLSRALGVAAAMLTPLNPDFFEIEQPIVCKGCGLQLSEEPDPCPYCGGIVCDACILNKGGCGAPGCPSASQGDESMRASARAATPSDAQITEAVDRGHSHQPMAEISTLPADIEQETMRLQRAADAMRDQVDQ